VGRLKNSVANGHLLSLAADFFQQAHQFGSLFGSQRAGRLFKVLGVARKGLGNDAAACLRQVNIKTATV
jgi:hypothetical protein